MYQDEIKLIREDLEDYLFNFHELYDFLLNSHDETGALLYKQVIDKINNLIFYVDAFVRDDEWP